ncbi:tripartite tricarboxylate transporter substrate binding protein [Variovorax rhizosphaerae]|uniref:Tripartite tricarboxylate transporter substrate binding protein n=1 Tax=Variovorax rhizosphaerae TaxID=1836200 RepID=A0ABU8WTE4_9BURK
MIPKLFAALALALSIAPAGAQNVYPVRPVKLLVGFAPGGATDQLARLFAMKLTERLGQPVIVDNRPGSGGNIAVHQVAQASPDGHTLVMAANYVAVNSALGRNPYNWQRDLSPVALIASTPNLLVVPANSKIHALADILEAAKRPGSNVTYGSPGMGSSVHLAGELFSVMAGVKMTHVPYKGVAPAEVDLSAGVLDLMFDSISTAVPLVEAGRLRALAVTGKQRVKALPNVPTMEELGMKGFNVEATYMVLAPAKTPTFIVEKLCTAIADISRQPEVQRFEEGLYAQPLKGGAAETNAFLKGEEQKWVDVVKASGLKID